MRHRITRFSVHQTAKVAGAVYALVALVLIPLFVLVWVADPQAPFGSVWFAFFAPLVYGFFGYVMTMIGAWMYNFVAAALGGIEFDLAPAAGTPAAPGAETSPPPTGPSYG